MIDAHGGENGGVDWRYGEIIDRITMTYQRCCKFAGSDIQDLDARVSRNAHERVTVLGLRPHNTVVVDLLIVGRGIFCSVLLVFKPAQDVDSSITVQFAPTYDGKGASAHSEHGVVAGSGIGIEVYVVELGRA